MKIIEVDEELYQYIASQTQSIGESASDILRRLLNLSLSNIVQAPLDITEITEPPIEEKSAVEIAPVLSVSNETKAETTAEKNKPSLAQSALAFASDDLETALYQLLHSAEFQQENKAVNRFLAILTQLYQANANAFAQAIDNEAVQGRTRTYFAQDEQTLLKSGNHTKPKQIPHSPYWVITNNNSGRKMIMLEGVMRGMQLPENLINQVKDAFVGG